MNMIQVAAEHNARKHETMAAALDATDAYRVLRRLQPRSVIQANSGSVTRVAALVDVETTGLDHERDEIVELAMVKFTYGADGTIYGIGKTYERFNQPGRPLSPAITKLTGITDQMVAGKTLDSSEITAFLEDVDLVVAHNAAFDRRFLERSCESFLHKPWGCSMSQVDWREEGYEGTKLGYLAAAAGFFYDRHRAAADCLAAIELLALPLPASGATGMRRLLDNARTPTWRIWAERAPFELKDLLKVRGYRWNAGGTGPKSWYIDVRDEAKESEIAYLRAEIYHRDDFEATVRKVTAYERVSDRV
jgi:DNA polymerase-3 subunit epsilon